MGKGEILFIPKAFFSLVTAPWVLFRTSWGQYSRTFSWPAGSQAWNRQEVIKGAVTAAAPHPLLPWDEARQGDPVKATGGGRERDSFHVCFSVRRDTKHSMTGLVGHSSLLLGWMTVLKVKVWESHLDWYLGCALMLEVLKTSSTVHGASGSPFTAVCLLLGWSYTEKVSMLSESLCDVLGLISVF